MPAPRPSETGAEQSQGQETTRRVEGELVSEQLPIIKGEVSRDFAGLAEVRPELLADRGTIWLTASYSLELRRQLDHVTTQRERLSDQVSGLRENNARLDQALSHERAAQTPRAMLSTLAGIFIAVSGEQFAERHIGAGSLATIVGVVILIAISLWRTSRKQEA